MISVPSLPQALDSGLRKQIDTWDETRLHVSDLPVAIGEKCPRQLWLRIRGAEKKKLTAGKLLMFDHGKRIHERLVELMLLPEDWEIESVESPVDIKGITGRYDTRLFNTAKGWELIVDFKTVRGNKFNYLDEAMPAHVLQVQAYIAGSDADGGLVFYVDREGQNQAKQFFVKREDERVFQAIEIAKNIAEQKFPPPLLEPVLKISKNKGPDSVKLCQDWKCDYCEYQDVSCPGALKPYQRKNGIIGHIVKEKFQPKEGYEKLAEVVESLLDKDRVPF